MGTLDDWFWADGNHGPGTRLTARFFSVGGAFQGWFYGVQSFGGDSSPEERLRILPAMNHLLAFCLFVAATVGAATAERSRATGGVWFYVSSSRSDIGNDSLSCRDSYATFDYAYQRASATGISQDISSQNTAGVHKAPGYMAGTPSAFKP